MHIEQKCTVVLKVKDGALDNVVKACGLLTKLGETHFEHCE